MMGTGAAPVGQILLHAFPLAHQQSIGQFHPTKCLSHRKTECLFRFFGSRIF